MSERTKPTTPARFLLLIHALFASDEHRTGDPPEDGAQPSEDFLEEYRALATELLFEEPTTVDDIIDLVGIFAFSDRAVEALLRTIDMKCTDEERTQIVSAVALSASMSEQARSLGWEHPSCPNEVQAFSSMM